MHSNKILSVGILVIISCFSIVRVTEAENSTATLTVQAPSVNSKNGSVTFTPGSVKWNSNNSTNSTGKLPDEESCEDDEPLPEPEGKSNGTSSDSRQGKELSLTEKDKYSHENGTAEPEPEGTGQTSANVAGSKDKLTSNGTATTPAPQRGGAETTLAVKGSLCLLIGFASLISA